MKINKILISILFFIIILPLNLFAETWVTESWSIEILENSNSWELDDEEWTWQIVETEIIYCWIVFNPVSFTDIDDSFAKEHIRYLADRWIVNWFTEGWSYNNKFWPKQKISRIEFLKIVIWSTCEDEWNDFTSYYFSDIEEWTWHARVVNEWISKWAITTDNWYFRPNDTISRAEALKILFKIHDFEIPNVWATFFTDVNWWAVNYVEYAKNLWIISANSSYFKPNDGMTREEAAKIITLALRSRF